MGKRNEMHSNQLEDHHQFGLLGNTNNEENHS